MKWQPIETAPKDGTRFLAYCPGFEECWIEIAVWDDGSELHKSWRINSLAPPYGDEPTHWMPLPEPPKEK